jgi:acetyl esterase/lipase
MRRRGSAGIAGLRIPRVLVVALAAISLTAISLRAAERPPDRYAVPDEVVRQQTPEGVRFIPNIAYREGVGEPGLLDLAMPADPGAEKLPAIVFVHGGGWQSGSKRRPLFILPALRYAAAGYVCIAVNYRLAQEAPFPTAVEDVKTAVRWLRAHADQYRVDPDRIGAFGNSAGAHLALMLAMVGPDAGLEGDLFPEHSSAVQAVCASAVPADFGVWVPGGAAPDRGPGTFLAGPEDTIRDRVAQASPISYVRADAPPLLLIHGSDDTTVPVAQLDRFVEAMRSAGHQDLTYLRYEGASHMVFRQRADETEPAMARFFARTLGGGEPSRP